MENTKIIIIIQLNFQPRYVQNTLHHCFYTDVSRLNYAVSQIVALDLYLRTKDILKLLC
jgi:hypothetical protein